MLSVALLLLGLVLLVVGSDILVKGASNIALATGVSSLVVGLTVVAYGTSAPELVVGLIAAYSGEPDIALGNVVGSNILNVLGILGFSAVIVPLLVNKKLLKFDVPLMIGSSFAAYFFSLDGIISFAESLFLVSGAVFYTVFSVKQSRKQTLQENQCLPKIHRSGLVRDLGYVIFGLCLLLAGSRCLVSSAVNIAQFLGMSELVIGSTIVAIGTSLPELATSVMAAYRGERDIAIGNIVGSNILNILFVLGGAGALSPSGIAVAAGAIYFDIPTMVAVALLCLPIFYTDRTISRVEGCLFLIYYALYTAFLITHSDDAHSNAQLVAIIGFLFVPLSLIALSIHYIITRKKEQGKLSVELATPEEYAD